MGLREEKCGRNWEERRKEKLGLECKIIKWKVLLKLVFRKKVPEVCIFWPVSYYVYNAYIASLIIKNGTRPKQNNWRNVNSWMYRNKQFPYILWPVGPLFVSYLQLDLSLFAPFYTMLAVLSTASVSPVSVPHLATETLWYLTCATIAIFMWMLGI